MLLNEQHLIFLELSEHFQSLYRTHYIRSQTMSCLSPFPSHHRIKLHKLHRPTPPLPPFFVSHPSCVSFPSFSLPSLAVWLSG